MKIKEYKIVWEDNYIIKEISFMEEFNKIDRLENRLIKQIMLLN
jgi:hypothetical protein